MNPHVKSTLLAVSIPLCCCLCIALFGAMSLLVVGISCVNPTAQKVFDNAVNNAYSYEYVCEFVNNTFAGEKNAVSDNDTFIILFAIAIVGSLPFIYISINILFTLYFTTSYLALIFHLTLPERSVSFINCFKFGSYARNIVFQENKTFSYTVASILIIKNILELLLGFQLINFVYDIVVIFIAFFVRLAYNYFVQHKSDKTD